jgi:hypothetical protein
VVVVAGVVVVVLLVVVGPIEQNMDKLLKIRLIHCSHFGSAWMMPGAYVLYLLSKLPMFRVSA